MRVSFFDSFKWVVKLPSKRAGFFVPLCPPSPLGNFLIQIKADPHGCRPEFSDVPSLYPITSALFLVRELRRVGYNASMIPFPVLMVRDALRAFLSRLKARRASKARWK